MLVEISSSELFGSCGWNIATVYIISMWYRRQTNIFEDDILYSVLSRMERYILLYKRIMNPFFHCQ